MVSIIVRASFFLAGDLGKDWLRHGPLMDGPLPRKYIITFHPLGLDFSLKYMYFTVCLFGIRQIRRHGDKRSFQEEATPFCGKAVLVML